MASLKKLATRIESPRTVLTLFDSSNVAEVDFLVSLYLDPEVSGMQKANGEVTNALTTPESLLKRFRFCHLDPALSDISGGYDGHCLYLVNMRPGLQLAGGTKDTGESLGPYIGFVAMNHRAIEVLDIGYIISPVFWGQGFATEACKTILSYVTGEMEVERVCGFTRPRNKASMRVLEKSGFVHVGDGVIVETDGVRHVCEMFVLPSLEGEGLEGGKLEGWALHIK